MSAARIAYFTAGTVGAGHLARGFAIERALARAGSPATFTTIGPVGGVRLGGRGAAREVPIDAVALANPGRAQASELAAVLREARPDVLLVDLFWAPLRHLLPLTDGEAWLLVRRVPAAWFKGPPGLPFERGLFTRILGIEPGLSDLPLEETIAPIVAVNPDEMRPPGALRDALGVPSSSPLHVIHQAGERDEWRALLQVRPERPVHVFTPGLSASELVAPAGVHVHDGQARFPLARWLGDATALACGAGYNAFWEAHRLGLAARTTFASFRRNLDDQAWRVRTCRGHVPTGNGADELARRLA